MLQKIRVEVVTKIKLNDNKTQNLKLSQNSRTINMTQITNKILYKKFKHKTLTKSNGDKTQNSNGHKTQNVTKIIINSNWDTTQVLNFCHNSKAQIVTKL